MGWNPGLLTRPRRPEARLRGQGPKLGTLGLAPGLALLAVLTLACGGAAPLAQPASAPPVPAAPAQPAPAAPAAQPQPAAAPAAKPPVSAPAPVGPQPAAVEPKYGGVLRLSIRGDPPAAFDPMRVTTQTLSNAVASMFGDGNLVRACREDVYRVCPNLAVQWEHNGDFTQWTFRIREGVLWHDGAPFTVDDAKFWIELAAFGAASGGKTRAPAIWEGALGDLKKVEASPGGRLRLTLESPRPLFLETIMNPRHKMAHPRHLMQLRIEKGEVAVAPYDIGSVGTGAFALLKYERGTRAQVRRFDQYWEKDPQGRQLPFLEGIEFAIIRDPAAMDAAFRVGRLDGGGYGRGPMLTKERQVGYIRDLGDRVWFAQIGGRGGELLSFNVLRPGPWQDVRVRRAMALWIDKEAAFTTVLGGFGEFTSLLSAKNPFTSPDFVAWPGWNPKTKSQDRAEAKRLLAAAGFERGFPMGHLCHRERLEACEFLHGQLAGLGVDLKIQIVDTATWGRERTALNHDAQLGTHSTAPFPEATETRFGRYRSNPDAAAKHEDPKVDEHYRRLNRATSYEQRVQIWREFERYYLLEQVYIVPLGNDVEVVPYRTHVKGLLVPAEDSQNNLDFATVWLDK